MTAQMLQQSTYAPFGNLGTNLFGPPLQYPHHMRFKNHDHRQLRDRTMPTLEPFRSPCSAGKWSLLSHSGSQARCRVAAKKKRLLRP